jgi:hypothetical protein
VGNGKEKTVKNTIPACSDMVLIYGGGKQRTLVWNEDRFLPYVCYKDTSDVEHWFFDGFLFLELSTQSGNTPQHVFATDYKGIPANKADWTAQADYYFTHGISIDALDKCIGKTARKIGKPITKRKVIIALPEPIVAGEGTMYADVMDSCYWGAINGKPLNFGNKADRIAAVKWYIDLIRSRFQAEKFKHVELAGFYWTPEHTRHTRDLLDEIGLYLNNLKYSFNWIPYFNPKPDYYEWNTLGFHYAYLQPNYFFRENVPYSRLEEACQRAEKYGLNLEFEFDNRAMKDNKNWGYRLRNYIKAYRESGLLPLKRIAYYQGGDGAMYQLLHSSNKEDVDLYHEFCRFVLEHQSLYHN